MSVCVHVCAPQVVSLSLFAGDTPPVYTAPANAIPVVGPCLWVLLEGCAYENRPGTHNSLFRWSCTVLQNVFRWLLHDLNLVESLCVGMCVHVFVCLSVCVCCVSVCVQCVCTYVY